MAITASLHIEDMAYSCVPHDEYGNPEGMAQVWKLSEPKDLDGDGVLDEYVIVRLLWRRYENVALKQGDMHAEIALFPCDETGAWRGKSVVRRMGSFPLVPDPKGNAAAIRWSIAVAFSFYDIVLEEVGNDGA